MLFKWLRLSYSNKHLQILPAFTCPAHFIRGSIPILLTTCLHAEKLTISEEQSLTFLYILQSKTNTEVYNYIFIFATLACNALRKTWLWLFWFLKRNLLYYSGKSQENASDSEEYLNRCYGDKHTHQTLQSTEQSLPTKWSSWRGTASNSIDILLEKNQSSRSEWEALLKSQILWETRRVQLFACRASLCPSSQVHVPIYQNPFRNKY